LTAAQRLASCPGQGHEPSALPLSRRSLPFVHSFCVPRIGVAGSFTHYDGFILRKSRRMATNARARVRLAHDSVAPAIAPSSLSFRPAK